MLTSNRNIFVEVVAVDTRDLTEITNDLATMGFEIESSENSTRHGSSVGTARPERFRGDRASAWSRRWSS